MLKVEYAPPGTDPTRLPTKRNEVGLQAVVRQNWLLILGLLVFAFAGYQLFASPSKQSTPQATPQTVSAAPAPTAAPVANLPGCWGPLLGYESVIQAGRRYDPGPWVVDIDPVSGKVMVVNCHEDGSWFFLNVAQTEALPDTPQMGAVSGPEEGTSSESGAP